MFTGFLVGFITVLCIGNYFRAKRAQERQRQRRLNKQAAASQQAQTVPQPTNSSSLGSPRSSAPGASVTPDSLYSTVETGGTYEAPPMPVNSAVRA